MLVLENQIIDISEINSFAYKFCKDLKVGDVLFFKGELGVGKTTLARYIINNLHLINNIALPKLINSPTFPILLTYHLSSFEIYHYDLYRIKNIKELEELDFFENINNSITLIEWPELLIDLPFEKNYYVIYLNLYSVNKREIKIEYFN